jgi:hypothetical protein
MSGKDVGTVLDLELSEEERDLYSRYHAGYQKTGYRLKQNLTLEEIKEFQALQSKANQLEDVIYSEHNPLTEEEREKKIKELSDIKRSKHSLVTVPKNYAGGKLTKSRKSMKSRKSRKSRRN